MSTLPSWADQMQALEGGRRQPAWPLGDPTAPTEAEVQDMNKLALSILACGYLCHVYTDERRPVFMPLWNYACNQGGPDPDYVYSTAEIDPTASTRSRAIAAPPASSRSPSRPSGMMTRLKGHERT